MNGVTSDNGGYLELEIKPLISKFLADRGLELSKEKTKITHIRQGFDFLGFNIRKYNDKCLTKPKKDSVKSIYSNISNTLKLLVTSVGYFRQLIQSKHVNYLFSMLPK
jgi:RNA-directed DNA polymerase